MKTKFHSSYSYQFISFGQFLNHFITNSQLKIECIFLYFFLIAKMPSLSVHDCFYQLFCTNEFCETRILFAWYRDMTFKVCLLLSRLLLSIKTKDQFLIFMTFECSKLWTIQRCYSIFFFVTSLSNHITNDCLLMYLSVSKLSFFGDKSRVNF